MPFSGSGASTTDARRIFDQPGRLIVDPTSLLLPFPYGGTYLGLAQEGATLEFAPVVSPIRCTDHQVQPYNFVYAGMGLPTLDLILDQWTEDAKQLFYPGSTAGNRFSAPGSLPTGLLAPLEAVTVLFDPQEPTHDAVLIHQAIPFMTARAFLEWRSQRPTRLALRFSGLVAAGKANTVEIDLLANLEPLVP